MRALLSRNFFYSASTSTYFNMNVFGQRIFMSSNSSSLEHEESKKYDSKGKRPIITSLPDALKFLDMLSEDSSFYPKKSYSINAAPFKFPMGVWFRGHSNENYGLQPSVFRSQGGTYDESSMIYEFQFLSSRESQSHSSTFEWLTLMQHYGVPTRLLDWTEKIFIALYFACAESKTNMEDDSYNDGEIIAINAAGLNHISGIGNHEFGIGIPSNYNVVVRSEMALLHTVEQLERRDCIRNNDSIDKHMTTVDQNNRHTYPVAVFPKRISPRMRAQYGNFTIHGGKVHRSDMNESEVETLIDKPGCLYEVNQQSITDNEQPLLKFAVIPHDCKKVIRSHLEQATVSSASLFPEIDSRSKLIASHWWSQDQDTNQEGFKP